MVHSFCTTEVLRRFRNFLSEDRSDNYSIDLPRREKWREKRPTFYRGGREQSVFNQTNVDCVFEGNLERGEGGRILRDRSERVGAGTPQRCRFERKPEASPSCFSVCAFCLYGDLFCVCLSFFFFSRGCRYSA